MYKLLGAIVLTAAILFVSVEQAISLEADLELSHERFYAIKSEIGQRSDAVIVFGDSIVQGAEFPAAICGHAVVNAGVAGAAVEYFERHAANLLGTSHPKLIVLAVGINNASPRMATQFRLHYQRIVASLSRAAPVAVATITPVRSGNGSIGYAADLVPSLNDAIRKTPKVSAVIDLNTPLAGANWTTDGIHLGPEGYALWTQALLKGVNNVLGCTKR